MGRQSKATMARRGNIGRPNNAQKPPVEEVSDEDSDFEDDDLLEHGFFFLDEESLSEEDLDGSDEELDEDELHGLISEAKIEHFNAILFEAQAMAVKAGREASFSGELLFSRTRSRTQIAIFIPYLIGHLISYANRAARFISAYGQGLTGPEAAWANRKYHGHRTLPPDMALKLKKEHEEKYSIQENNVP